MDKYTAILVICLLSASSNALKLPGYIKKCSLKDPEFKACALKSARDAIPHIVKGEKKYHIPPLDPLTIKEIRVVDGNLNMAGLDIKVEGINNITLESISFDFDKKKIVAEVRVPEVHFSGHYEVKGKLMALPITGKGSLDSTFYDLYVKYTTGFDLKKMDDGELYLEFSDYNVDFEPKNVVAKLGNLFNGNKLLGDNMNAFINENWRGVLKEIGQPTYDAISLIVHNIISAAAKTVPYKDMFDDTE